MKVLLQLRLREVDGLSLVSTVYVKVLPETPMASTDVAEMVELLEAGSDDQPAGQLFMRAQGLRKQCECRTRGGATRSGLCMAPRTIPT